MRFVNESKKETLVYAVIWVILFLTPVLSIYLHSEEHSAAGEFPWHELLHIWEQYLIFFVAFLIHNYLLAPRLVYKQQRAVYFSAIAVLLLVFATIQCTSRPERCPAPPHQNMSVNGPPPKPMFDDFDDGQRPEDGLRPDDSPRPDDGPRPDDIHRPPLFFGQQDIIAFIMFTLMLGMNLGIKFYFRQRKDQERMALLERENLEQQLEYLKYQINPHFLMNTLNNIHALVDIDPEQAKETIVELSKIMRFVLYEGSKQKVPLRQELLFLDNYINLMKMRITDNVALNVDMPDMLPDSDIPPLMLITFIENAFKHGVSYQQPSFIDINVSIHDNRLLFTCRNSKIPHGQDQHGGVGLKNVMRRLELIYGSDYTLDFDDAPDCYSVKLEIPL